MLQRTEDSGASAEILTVLVHLIDFGQQDLFDSFRVGHSVPPLVKSDIIPDQRAALTTSKFHQ